MKSQIHEHQKSNFKIVSKKIKILVLLVTIAVATFYSCTDNNPIENEMVAEKSMATRTAMNELKIANGISDKDATNPFCFDFVYPITLSYNTGTNVTVTSLQGLLTILASENSALYIDGIAFPFQVTHNGAIQNIGSESQFIALLMSCGFNTINLDLLNSFCFDIVFPVTVVGPNGQNITITSMQGFIPYLNNPSNGQVQFVFPISVTYQGQVVVIDNIYELYQMINNCDDCVCMQVYQPVCVQTATGIVEFGNMCFAECAGFTQNDLVPCNGSSPCSISNLVATAGTCNGTNFPVTLNFSYQNAPGSNFQVRNESDILLGTYPLSSLPLTINYGPNDGSVIRVKLGNNCAEAYQIANTPICTNCGCPSTGTPVCVQTSAGTVQYANQCLAICAGHSPASIGTCPTGNFSTQLGNCFTMTYPVQIQHQGALVTVTNNSQLLQYFFPNQSPIPAFVYPVTATFGNQTVTIQTQSAFQSFIQANCN